MFDLGWSELVVIAVVALVAIGPKELPGVLRSVGHWMGKIRRMAAEFQGQFQEAMREAEMADLKKHADDLNNAAKQLTSTFDPYDTFKESEAAKTAPAVDTAAVTPPPSEPSVSALKAEAADTAQSDYGQVAAMPDTSPVPETPMTEAGTSEIRPSETLSHEPTTAAPSETPTPAQPARRDA